MIQAGTSTPSGAIATNGSGPTRVTSARNVEPTSVTCRPSTNTSGGLVGVEALYASRSPTRSKPVSTPAGAAYGTAGPDPSVGTSNSGMLPASSHGNTIRAPSQIGPRIAGNGAALRSSASVKTVRTPVVRSTMAIRPCRGSSNSPGMNTCAIRSPSGDQTGSRQAPSVAVTRTGAPPRASIV